MKHLKEHMSIFISLFSFMLLILFSTSGWAEDPIITFEKFIGGPIHDGGRSVSQTIEGGYIITGMANYDEEGTGDVYLVKTDENGNIIWERTYGGPDQDQGNSVQQTIDGGFIIAGFTYSYGGGIDDAYVIKTDQDGNLIWEKTFGGPDSDRFLSADLTTDGGVVYTGYLHSIGGISGPTCLIKTDINGNVIWEKMYGERTYGSNTGDSVQQTSDGGFIISGGKAYGPNESDWDVWLIRTDALGNLIWEETYGGVDWDIGYSVHETQEGGFIIAGTTYSFGAGACDFYLIKTDGFGNALWQRTYGGVNEDWGLSVDETSDGGFVITGWTHSFGDEDFGDAYLIKTDAIGNVLWERIYGCQSSDQGHFIQETSDQGLIIAGNTHSFGNWGQVYLIKTDENGDISLLLKQGDSLWVQTQFMAPMDFNGLTLFWGMLGCCDSDFEYNVYRPEGCSGGAEEDPFSCDLSQFLGNKLIFEFKINAGMVRLRNDAYVWDYNLPGGMIGFCGYPFFFAFYQLDETGWSNREIIEYMPGEVCDTEPPHGDLFFNYPSDLGCAGSIRSDFHESIPISVTIDIKPGSFPNSINLSDQGLLPVAILGSTEFDVNQIYTETVEIGGVNLAQRGSAKSPKLSFSYEDVNSDGITDMMLFFELQRLVSDGVLTENTTALKVTATLSDGKIIKGSDSVNIVH